MTITKTNVQFNILMNLPEEVLVESNNKKNKEIDITNMKKHDVGSDCKEDEDIQHYNGEYKYGTSKNYKKEKNGRGVSSWK